MRYRLSITFKLLLVIIPLVCAPIGMVGYFSIQASVDRVNRLVRHEQMVKVEAAAKRINDVFYNCRIDLGTITGLPVLEDFHLARSFRLLAEAEFNRDNLLKIFREILRRNPYYYRIRYLDQEGTVLAEAPAGGAGEVRAPDWDGFAEAAALGPRGLFFSDMVESPRRRGFVLYCAQPVYSGWHQPAGLVVIDLDFEKIIQAVRAIQVGRKGYAFLVDDKGRNLVHPNFPPYRYGPDNYPDPSLHRLVADMMAGRTGWDNYTFQGQDKVAAFAPIPIMKWSLAVTIPVEEFRSEAQAIQTRVIQVVLIALLISVAGVSILSYNLLKPVRNLVSATDRIARGELGQEIPVRSHDELGELTRSFNRMVRNLASMQDELVRSEKFISLGRLSAGVAHEIRNPLNAMKGAMVHLRRRRPQDPLIREYTGLVMEEIERLSRFVTEFLFFAKQAPPRREPADLNRLVLATQRLFSGQAQERGVGLRNQLDDSLPLVPLDSDQMEQVLINLVINAMDAMERGGTITFTTARRGDRVLLTISDQGQGIAPEHLGSVFDPFFTTKETGTGLGLPLCLGIVESHGGTIRLESRPGRGTKVIIELPAEEAT